MKLTKSYIKQLIRESLNEIERQDPREDPEGVYGVDPTGEMGREAKYDEGEAEENEVIRELEEILTSLMGVKKKLELAQKKENK
jgi:hypothetical protein